MKLIIITGPQAVGKMTVGQELAKITELKLFHNHMTIDLVSNFFSYGSPAGKRLVSLFRQEIFEEVSKSDLYGLIFTYVCAFNDNKDFEYIKNLSELFKSRGGDVYIIELEASIEERLKRNTTPNRLECKPSKRNIEWSEQELIRTAQKYRMNSTEGEIVKNIKDINYLKIKNDYILAEDAAKMIQDKFDL